LEHILTPLRQFCPQVLTPSVSSRAQAKLFSQRRLYRQDRFAAYFASARPKTMNLDKVAWLGFPFGQGSPLPAPQTQRLAQLLETPILHAEQAADLSLVLVGRRLTEAELALIGKEMAQDKIFWVNWGNLELRLVGLLDADLMSLGLGLLLPSPWERRQVILHTPLPYPILARVRFCRLGKLRLDLTGAELPPP
jgi:polynucleotide 5'-kinase involved in rRNA processing